jgi:membrane protease YdiL (CAAX protease family)
MIHRKRPIVKDADGQISGLFLFLRAPFLHMKKKNNKRANPAEEKRASLIRGSGNRINKMAAGLSWILLEKSFRRKVALFLGTGDLEALNKEFRNYKNSSGSEKHLVNRKLLKDLRVSHGGLPFQLVLISAVIVGAVFMLHRLVAPSFPDYLRLRLFTPMILGALSFLTFYMVPPYRLYPLFRPSLERAEIIALPVTFIGLLWTLTYIQFETDPSRVYHPRGMELLILLAGAVWAPLLEEILFREVIPSMFGGADQLIGHVPSMILFSLAHLPSTWDEALLYFIAGTFLSMLRYLTGGLFYPLLVHAAANAVMVLVV